MKALSYPLACAAEVDAWTDLYRRAPAGVRSQLGIAVERLAGATIALAPGVDHPLLNRAWVANPTPERVEAVAARFAALGVGQFFIHTERRGDAMASVDTLETVFPFRRNWVRLAARLDGTVLPGRACELSVRLAEPSNALTCARIYCEGFDVPAHAAPLFAAIVGQPGWRAFLALTQDGEPAGTGLVFTGGRLAYLAGAATRPEFRGRGAQGALMSARVYAAAASGCEWIASDTGEVAPGDPQHSQRNMERHGLRVVGVTLNLVPASMGWRHGSVPQPAPAA